QGRVAMDIGAATGGFTDVLLRAGAQRVYAIDVGYGQLDWQLRNDPRVVVMERTNARYLARGDFPVPPDLCVMDVSFISIELILPAAMAIVGTGGRIVSLIKPQFEAGRENVGKKGVVRDPAVHEAVLKRIHAFVESQGWRIRGIDFSPITGPEGNIEFLMDAVSQAEARECLAAEDMVSIVARAHEHFTKKR
nr:TlyA family RNA methyltransferase [Clostridia bacterium]